MQSQNHESIGAKLEVRSLVKLFGIVRAVDDLSFSADPGSFVTLLGPSGSGKTTTLNIIAGFEDPTSGDVLLNGELINTKPPNKRNIGMVFQNYALFPHMTAAENVAYPLLMRRLDKSLIHENVYKAMQLVQLEGYENRYPKQLSGGQQQRIALARALVFMPPLLLMDEPLGALDKKLREQLQIEIKRIQNQLSITVIYVTHDQEEALVMSDKIIILQQGRLQQIGGPLEVYERPRNHFVADFIGETNILQGEIFNEMNQYLLKLDHLDAVLEIPAEMNLTPGKISVSIRPEKLWLETWETEKNGLEGVVDELIYVGESTKYLIKGFKKQLIVKQQRGTNSIFFQKGDRVLVRFRVEDLVFLRNEI
jgi:putative spermidine/putrescine transport system ATP-binding protein/spermidine/putrescine transport system ATP-binding protein